MFPSDKSCDASAEIADGRRIDVLKPQYYNLNDNGTLTKLTTGCNAYSDANVALVKQYSSQQFVTVSGNTAGMNALATNRNLTSAFLSEMYSFLQTSGFTGVELDFEGFGQWTAPQYANYKALIGVIGNALHARKAKLMIDGPAISDSTYQSYFLWKWEDFNNMLQVDFLTVMAYDEQADGGNGTPVASLSWLGNICQWMLSKIADHSRIIVGINSYGYHGKTGAYAAIKDTYQQSMLLPGFNTAKRDASSGEMTWTANGISYDYSDSTSLNLKLQTVLNSGISSVSVWHLGGNQWFTQIPQPTPTPTPTPSPAPTPPPASLTLTQDQIKAIVGTLSSDQIATLKSIVG
jgi:Predicted glycosyl hydrolase